MVPNALAAAQALGEQGIDADVICVTCPGLLFTWSDRRPRRPTYARLWILDQVFPAQQAAPLITVLDGHPHTLSFLSQINKVAARNLRVTEFGQSVTMEDVHALHGIDAGTIVRAALDLTD